MKVWPAADRFRVVPGQFDHGRVGARPSHQALARCLAEGQAELDARHGPHQGFVEILDGLDEVRLPEDEIDRLGLVDFDCRELHEGFFLFYSPIWRGLTTTILHPIAAGFLLKSVISILPIIRR